jgi:hypothetical protein
LKAHKHIIPVAGMQSEQFRAEQRRGSGAAELTQDAMRMLREKGILFRKPRVARKY